MSRDLDRQVMEMGPEYGRVVARLRAAATATCPRAVARWRGSALLLAASLLAAAALVTVVRQATCGGASPVSAQTGPSGRGGLFTSVRAYTLAYEGDAASVAELVRTQAPDGSWANDFLTRQNAAALRGNAVASVAYRKALRYLRSRGLEPLSERELRDREAQSRRMRRFG